MDRAQAEVRALSNDDGIGHTLLLVLSLVPVIMALFFVRMFLPGIMLVGIGVMFIILRRLLNIEGGFARKLLDSIAFMTAIIAAPFFGLPISPLAAYALIGLSAALAFISGMMDDDKESDLQWFIFGFAFGLAISAGDAVARYYSPVLYLTNSYIFLAILAVTLPFILAYELARRISRSQTADGRK